MSSQVILEEPSGLGQAAPPEENDRFELVDGDWVEKKIGAKASRVGVRVVYRLEAFNEAQPCGLVFGSDCGYKIFPHAPKLVRTPDASFVRSGRLPDDQPPDGNMEIVPDLAVEVVSPNDLAEEFEERVVDYLRVGVSLLWVLYPNTRRALVIRKGGTAIHLMESDELQGDDVLPGFTCRVDQFFPRKAS
jgi:Uma2 family endonuclease